MQDISEQRGYYLVIPQHIARDKDLKWPVRLLYGEIAALCTSQGYCWASNSYFAQLYNVSKETVSRWLSQLEDKEYIFTVIDKKDGNKRKIYIDHAVYYYAKRGVLTESSIPLLTESSIPIDQNVKQNNTINNINNNKDIYSATIPYREIIDYLNSRAGTRYKHTSSKTQSLIKARFNEGFTLDDFKTVIDKKVAEWKDDPKMCKYIRPETLFSNKFESYLNQVIPQVKEKKNNGPELIL